MNENLNLDNLTPREKEVVGYLIQGLSNPEIARALWISEHTAKYYVCSILEKIGAKNRANACYLLGKYGNLD